jgi:hypothetical protein
MAYYDDETRYANNPSDGNYYAGSPYDPYAEKKKAVAQWYQGYLGREGGADEIAGWAMNPNFGSVQQAIANSQEAKEYTARQQQAANQPAPQPAAFDPRNSLTSVFQRYGLDPNNPGHGLANIDYFLRRGGETGGGWGVQSNQQYWQERTAQEIEKALYGTVGNLIDTGAMAAAAPAPAATVTPPAPEIQQRDDTLYNLLLGRATQGLDIDRNDPIIRGQSDAYAANQERARRNYLADVAEQAGPLANLRGEQRVTAEQLGQNVGSFEAQLMARELESRRAEIADALTSMRGLLTSDQQAELQRQLSLLDDATRRLQIDQQGQQFGQQLAYNYEALDNSLLRQLLSGIGA